MPNSTNFCPNLKCAHNCRVFIYTSQNMRGSAVSCATAWGGWATRALGPQAQRAAFRKIVEKNFDYVGDNFFEEAKKIKYGETKDRPIYGEASIEETKELIEEEINITPLPFQSNKKNN